MNKAMEKKLRKKRVPANLYKTSSTKYLHENIIENGKSGCSNHAVDCFKGVGCTVCIFNTGSKEGRKLFEYWRKNKYRGVVL